jgi:hypothetical protein
MNIPDSPPSVAPPERTVVQNQIDPVLLDRFLQLVRDNYRNADKATFFLEERSGITNIYGITNLRDVLSHFATFLDPALSNEQRRDQLANAEEHLRRAILEPYQIATEDLIIRFQEVYQHYKRYVLPARDRYPTLSTAPSKEHIEGELRKIEQLLSVGRAAKGRNLWDAAWEQGVAAFIRAFDDLYGLTAAVEEAWYGYLHQRREKRNVILTAWSTISAAGAVLLGAFAISRYAERGTTSQLIKWFSSVADKAYIAVVLALVSIILILLVDRRRRVRDRLRSKDDRLLRRTRRIIEYVGNVNLEKQ